MNRGSESSCSNLGANRVRLATEARVVYGRQVGALASGRAEQHEMGSSGAAGRAKEKTLGRGTQVSGSRQTMAFNRQRAHQTTEKGDNGQREKRSQSEAVIAEAEGRGREGLERRVQVVVVVVVVVVGMGL